MVAPILADSAFIKFVQDKAHLLVENPWHIRSFPFLGIGCRNLGLLGHCTRVKGIGDEWMDNKMVVGDWLERELRFEARLLCSLHFFASMTKWFDS
jgi:hypothetical protein